MVTPRHSLNRRCEFCDAPIIWVEPGDKCGWAHVNAHFPVLRFWCRVEEELRRVHPSRKSREPGALTISPAQRARLRKVLR